MATDLQVNFYTSPEVGNLNVRKKSFNKETDNAKNSTSPPPTKKKKLEKTEKNKSNNALITSIFTHNPDIPELKLSNVKVYKEAMFSEKDFSEINIHPYIAKNLSDFGITNLTTIQHKAFGSIMADKDALIKSQTGSGKTLTYAVPIIHKLQEIEPPVSRKDGIFALIIVPTRELAIQSFELFQKICRSFNRIVPGILLGGEKKKSEKARLRKGINILVSTPGRLIDHINHTEVLSLKNIKWIVLDEADRTLELGYEKDIKTILDALNEQGAKRQTLLLSATLTSRIEKLSEISMRHPVFIDAAENDVISVNSDKKLIIPEQLKQNFILVPPKLRLVTLASFLLWKCRFSSPRKVIVFMSTQDMVDFHFSLFDKVLNSKQIKKSNKNEIFGNLQVTDDAKSLLNNQNDEDREEENLDDRVFEEILLLQLHGNMTQNERTECFNKFREADAGVLLCTDVGARGLDLPQVDWIVQYNPPLSCADYVHRVGRTARIGSKGSSVIFLNTNETEFIYKLEKEHIALSEMTVEKVLSKLLQNRQPGKDGKLPNSLEQSATDMQIRMETEVQYDKGLHESASQAYVSFVRSYASFPKEIRHIFEFKKLHLGHYAKSFALRDPPNKITGLGKGNWVKNEELKTQDKLREKRKTKNLQGSGSFNNRSLAISEYSSGFDGIVGDKRKLKRKK